MKKIAGLILFFFIMMGCYAQAANHWADATTLTTNSFDGSAQYITWSPVTADATGSVTQLRVNISLFGSPTEIRLGLYSQDGAKLAEGTATVTQAGYQTIAIASTPVTRGTTYFIAAQAASGTLYKFGCGAATGGYEGSNTYANGLPQNLPASWGGPLLTAGMYIATSLSADFTAVPVSGYVPLTVEFTDTSGGIISNWLWDFGDGSLDNQQNPTHQYNAAGVYTVSLTVSGSSGSSQTVKSNFVTVDQDLPVGDNAFGVHIGHDAHVKYGLDYPVTYQFTIPSGSTGLVAQYRYDGGPWNSLPEKQSTDIFNGINAARFDYSNNFAYVSVGLSRTSDDLYLRIADSLSQPVLISFVGIPKFYDNRSAAVTVSLDDWDADTDSYSRTAVDYLTNSGMYFTFALITDKPIWSSVQEKIDSSGQHMEIASHSVDHCSDVTCYVSYGYDTETTASMQQIQGNLTLPYAPHVLAYSEPGGYTDTALRAAITSAGYLVTRGVAYMYDFASWDSALQRYAEAEPSFQWWQSNTATDAANANSTFDSTKAAGGVYHLLEHPWQGYWYDGSPLLDHINYIKGKTDVWYVPFGWMYSYHFIQEMRGGLTVSAASDTYTVNASVSGGHGSVSPGTQTINQGNRASITITPDAGYNIASITDNGQSVAIVNPYIINDVTATHTVVVTFAINTYAVNASVSGGHGSVNPASQTINQGSSASITITSDPGYNIASIADNGQPVTVVNPYTISNVTATHTVVVTFALNTYAVNASVSGGHGSVSPGTQSINHGSSASITVTPDTGYNIASITDNGQPVTVANPCTISNVTAGHTVVVTFAIKTYAVNASVSGSHGLASPGTQTINHGNSASITITPDPGYGIASITDNGQPVTTVNPYVINNVSAAHTVVATFAMRTYAVNASVSGGHGSVSPGTQSINYGSSASITLTPDPGYSIASITDNGLPVTSARALRSGTASSTSPYVISNVTADHTVVVTFVINTYAVNASVSGGHGSVSPGTQTINYGGSTSISITPDPGYSIASITDNGLPVASARALRSGAASSTSPYVISNVTADHTVVVTFALNTYTVDASVSGGHGSVSPGTQSINHGSSASLTITPDTGYNIAGITDNGQPVTVANPYTISNITAAHTVVVTFSVTATLSVGKTGSGAGTVISGPQGINCGSTCVYSFTDGRKVTLTARPDANALFAGWSGGCSGTKPTCTVTMTEYTYVTAVFNAKEHTVSASVSGGHGSVSPGTQVIKQGENASLSITSDADYQITRITDNGRTMPIANPYVISNVMRDHAVVVTFATSYALFVAKEGSGDGTISSTPAGINCGSVCTSNIKSGTKIVLTAHPNSDALFSGWSEGCSGTRGTCTVTMDNAVNVIANFKSEANVVVTPLTRNYAVVKPGQKKPQAITVKNTGKKPLTIGALSLSGDTSFTVTGNTCVGKNLSTNQVCQVTVTFTPVSTLPVTASLSIPSNDLDTPFVTVSLAGNGGTALGAEADAGEGMESSQ